MKTLWIAPLAAALIASGCGSQPEQVEGQSQSASVAETKERATETQAESGIDWNKPVSDYVELNFDRVPLDQARDNILFNAALSEQSDMPVDYDQVARAVSSDYFNTQDAFAKKEKLDALKGNLERRIKELQQSPYGTATYAFTNNLEGYDFRSKSFPIHVLPETSLDQGFERNAMNPLSVVINWTNAEEARNVPVPDEALAKRIEGLRNGPNNQKPLVRVFFHGAVKPHSEYSTAFHHYLTTAIPATITRVQILTRDNELLAEFQPGKSNVQTRAPEVQADAASIANDF